MEKLSQNAHHKPGANKRVFSYLVDVLILAWAPSIIFSVLFGVELHWVFVSCVLLFRDFIGRSPGKAFVGLSIVDIKSNQEISILQALLRNFILLIPIAFIIEYIVLRNSSKGQRLGDKMSKTLVIDLHPERKDKTYFIYSLIYYFCFIVVSILISLVSV